MWTFSGENVYKKFIRLDKAHSVIHYKHYVNIVSALCIG